MKNYVAYRSINRKLLEDLREKSLETHVHQKNSYYKRLQNIMSDKINVWIYLQSKRK